MENNKMQCLSDEEIAQLKGGADYKNINKADYCICDNKPTTGITTNKNIADGCSCSCSYTQPPKTQFTNFINSMIGSCS